MSILFAASAAFCWAFSDLFATFSSKKNGWLPTVLTSQFVALMCYAATYFVFFRNFDLDFYSTLLILICGSLSAMVLSNMYKGFEVGQLSIISPVVASFSVLTVLIDVIFLGQKLNELQFAGIIFVIIGAILASFKWNDLVKLNWRNASAGIKYALIAMVANAIYFVLVDILVHKMNFFLPFFFIRMVMVPIIFIIGSRKGFVLPAGKTIAWVIIVGILEFFGMISFGAGVSQNYGAIVAPIAASFPAISAVLAWIFLKERIEHNQKLGVLLAVIGVVLLAR